MERWDIAAGKKIFYLFLAALEAALIRHNASIQIGEGVQAALNVYELPNLAVK
ncbi:hypothetical protein GCM10020331_054100 [Ectobacillus funiculus]